MTLMAFNAEPDVAHILTDTLSYMPTGRWMGKTSKVNLMPHADMAMLSQGPGSLSAAWRYNLAFHGQNAASIDDFDRLATELLPPLWDQFVQEQEPFPDVVDTNGIVFHIGYSPAHGRMKAYSYPSNLGFARQDVSDAGAYIIPAPVSHQPDPASEDDWRDLALTLRRERALASVTTGLKVFIGGDLLLTRMEPGAVTQRRIHTFDDRPDNPEFQQMVAGTLHPVAQLGPCECGSGNIQELCHSIPDDRDCLCGSGHPYEDCCRMPTDDLRAAQAATAPESWITAMLTG